MRLFEESHVLIEPGDRHLADDVVGGLLVGGVDDLTLRLVSQDGFGRGPPVGLEPQFIPVDGWRIEGEERELHFRHMLTLGANRQVCSILDLARGEVRVAFEEIRK
jgi:hypothetical protein